MTFTYYGHSCFSLQIGDKVVLFDPFISGNPLASNIQLNSIHADYILISHGHEDHIADAIKLSLQHESTVVSNFEIIQWLNRKGVNKTHPMNTGGKKIFEFGTVHCVNAVHSSSLPDGSYGGNPMGFVIESNEGNIYYSGDTALTYDMKLIAEKHNPSTGILPVGDNFTMGIEDAVHAAKYAGCSQVIGVHFDTFGLIKIDHEEAVRKFNENGIQLILPVIGSNISL